MEQRRKNLTQLFIPICLETLLYMLSGMVDTLMRILRRYSVIAENASDISARTAPTAAGTLSNVSPGRSTLLKCDCISFGPLTFKT